MSNKPSFLSQAGRDSWGKHNTALVELKEKLASDLDKLIKESESVDQFDSQNLDKKEFFLRGERNALRTIINKLLP